MIIDAVIMAALWLRPLQWGAQGGVRRRRPSVHCDPSALIDNPLQSYYHQPCLVEGKRTFMNITDNLFAGKLVRLAAPKTEDHEIMAKWTTNPEFSRMLDNDPAMPHNADYWAEGDKKDKERPNNFSFRIRTLEDDKLIGFIDLWTSWSNQGAWVGIGIGEPEYWGRGYGSDALRVGVNYAFRELGLYKVTLGVFSYNPRAVKAYEKVGFVHEGQARAMLYRDGQRHDFLYMGILRPEWEARINEQGL